MYLVASLEFVGVFHNKGDFENVDTIDSRRGEEICVKCAVNGRLISAVCVQ